MSIFTYYLRYSHILLSFFQNNIRCTFASNHLASLLPTNLFYFFYEIL
uniref:Uncharacterized protein n=1 Tax=Myoviridae sp. ctCL221 TaxID=2826630 RepID=A0A8S5M6R9_9CAUD|nr:MAG TPA: Protein of unknown function (DUF809) [Myoviridae sp. ctCL221]